ncbi:UNVERIFIED_CONTAM: hypothetical protein RMT77_009407 [Armadillidium vulgare]
MAIETSLGLQIPWERLVAIVDSSYTVERGVVEKKLIDLTQTASGSPKFQELSSRLCCCSHQLEVARGCPAKINMVTQAAPSREETPQNRDNSYSRGGRPRDSATWYRGQSNRRFQDNTRQSCFHCKRSGHTMSQCRARPLCRYCGKRGHQYDDCYIAQNRCLHCKEVGHLVGRCPTKNNDKLECPLCEGDHLGKDCPTNQGN